MLKTTSLVSILAFSELLYRAQLVYAANYKVIPLLIVASFWYLLVTSILQTGQFYIERYYGRGSVRVQQQTLIEKLWANMFTIRREGGDAR
jgi:polar amino acid transport system permease protein